jgi:GNAT superfamily N-acetyltransferase
MHWIRFNGHCARHSDRGQMREHDGIRAAWSHTILIVNNLTTPVGPVGSVAELAALGKAALGDAAPFALPWMFGIPEPWMPCGVEEANATLAEVGLRWQMYMTMMECEGRLAEPVRPLPTDVEARRVQSREAACDALHLNSCAYGMPVAVTEDVVASESYFADPGRDFGFVVYHEGKPVSTATAVDLGDWVYLAAVATHPEHRRKGYAEVAVRAALAAAPRRPMSLDASRAGEPLYAQMGYARRWRWNFWVGG